jgi:uncharacterized membrane protein
METTGCTMRAVSEAEKESVFRGREEQMKHTLTGTLSFAILATALATAQQYTITDLATLGGADSEANGINASGSIVGTSKVP